MTIELNIFNIAKLPRDRDKLDMDLIEKLLDHTFPSTMSDDHLQICLTHFCLDFNVNRSVDEVNALLYSSPSIDSNKWKLRIEQLAPTGRKPSLSSESPLKLELNLLLDTLEYAILGKWKHFARNHFIFSW